MTETTATTETPNDQALELAGKLVSIIQDDKLNDQEKVKKVKKFIEENKGKGLDLNVKGVADGRTVLHYAAEFGTPEMVQALVEAGAQEHITDNGGALPIHLATQNKKHPKAIEQLNIHAYANARDSQKETPLFKAVRAGNLEAVNILLDNGADINADAQKEGGFTGQTLLHHAALYGTAEIVRTLLEKGVDINATLDDDWTPLHLAAGNINDPNVLSVFLEKDEMKAKINAPDVYGETPLHWAARYGTPGMVQALIEAGADVDAQSCGWTPLHSAVLHGTPEVVKALLRAGANVDAKNKDQKTALQMLEAELQKPDLKPEDKERLEKNKTALGETDAGNDGNAGKTEPKKTTTLSQELIDAIKEKNVEKVRAKIAEDGFDPNAQGEHGSTPLHYAARYGTPEMVKALIGAGADVNAKNKYDWTPLHYAAQYGTPEMVEALLKARADKSIKNAKGKTARDLIEARIAKETDEKKKAELKKIKTALEAKKAEPNDGKPKDDKPKGDKDDKPKRTGGARPSGGKPSGKPKPTTTERPPEAQGPTAGDTTPGGAPATQPAQEESGGIGHWIRNSWFGSFFGLDDESVAKRAQSAQVLASYGEEGGGWFSNSLIGRWFGLDDASRIKKLQAANPTPVTPQVGTTTMHASYGAGREVPTHTVARPANAAGYLRGSSGGDLTRARDGQTPRGQIPGQGRGM